MPASLHHLLHTLLPGTLAHPPPSSTPPPTPTHQCHYSAVGWDTRDGWLPPQALRVCGCSGYAPVLCTRLHCFSQLRWDTHTRQGVASRRDTHTCQGVASRRDTHTCQGVASRRDTHTCQVVASRRDTHTCQVIASRRDTHTCQGVASRRLHVC